MKICIVSPPLGYRGSEKYVAQCACIYREMEKDAEVIIISQRAGNGFVYESLRAKKYDIRQYENDEEMRGVYDEIIRENPTFIHIHRAGWFEKKRAHLLKKAHKNNIPVIETNIFGRIDYFTGRYIDAHLHVSLWDLFQWNSRKRMLPYSRSQFGIYLPNCIDSAAFMRSSEEEIRAFKEKHNIPAGNFVVGRIGNTNWNAISVALHSFVKRHENTVLISVDDHAGKHAAAATLLVDAQVRVIPLILTSNELCAFYSACDIFLASSGVGETFGYVIAESMLCETPVLTISTPNYGNAQTELVVQNKTGFIAGSLQALAPLLNMLYENPEHIARARLNCRARVVSEYDKRVVAERLKIVANTIMSCRENFSRKEFVKKLKQQFAWKSPHSIFFTIKELKKNSYPPHDKKSFAQMILRWNPFWFFLHERMRVLIKKAH
jgi:Glycosyltransferase